MLIAVAAIGSAVENHVPETFEESRLLYIIETDDGSIAALYKNPGENGLLFAENTIVHNCEAISCGRFLTASAFDLLAGACITRYYAAGLPVQEAALAAEKELLACYTFADKPAERPPFIRGVVC